MNFKSILLGSTLSLAFAAAQAGTIQVGGVDAGVNGRVSAKSGVCTVDFNSGNATNACGATYTQGANQPIAASHFRSGTVTGQYVAPVGDTTTFLTVGATDGSSITITLATPANYFGFYAGSLDSYNLVQFFLNGVMVDSFTGTQINAVAFPNSAMGGTAYIDYFPGSLYNSIVYSSPSNAFETDNHAFGIATPTAVPEPESLALLGLGALALFARRRKSVK